MKIVLVEKVGTIEGAKEISTLSIITLIQDATFVDDQKEIKEMINNKFYKI